MGETISISFTRGGGEGGAKIQRRRSRWDDNRNEVRKRRCSNPIIIGHIPRTPTTPMSGLEDRDF